VPEDAPHEVSRLVSRFLSFAAFCAMSGRWVDAREAIVDEIVEMFAELTRHSAIVDFSEVQGSAGNCMQLVGCVKELHSKWKALG
jgi:hypothetical protein